MKKISTLIIVIAIILIEVSVVNSACITAVSIGVVKRVNLDYMYVAFDNDNDEYKIPNKIHATVGDSVYCRIYISCIDCKKPKVEAFSISSKYDDKILQECIKSFKLE